MKVLIILESFRKNAIKVLYFRNEKKAYKQQNSWFCVQGWKVIYWKDRGISGHRYELKYAKFNEDGTLNPKYIICFTKKEALYLKTKILEVYPDYQFQIRKIY